MNNLFLQSNAHLELFIIHYSFFIIHFIIFYFLKGFYSMKYNPLLEQSLRFASDIIKLQKFLLKEKKETIISKQIIRSSTSIGANINEANYASSKADFISKLHIALKECAETEYWIRLLEKSEYISNSYSVILLNSCLSIKKMLVSSLNTIKNNN